MKPRPKVLALILAGGAGGRLGPLTADRAKPAVPFAGTHRLVDFALSNCLHSGLSDVWVVEQSELHSLNDHLANGRPWDLDRTHGGLLLLPPSAEKDGDAKGEGGFAQGNADALWRLRTLLREFAPDLLLVLSADHLYRCDFRDVVDAHLSRGSDIALTLVTTPVPPEDDPRRFSLLRTDPGTGRVTDFAYKPKQPESDLAAAEIFLFQPERLLTALEDLVGRGEPLKDYGDALLPKLVDDGQVFTHPLEGYWRDVGTIESLWRAHRDLLADEPPLRLDDPAWPILTAVPQRLSARVFGTARVDNALLSPGCEVRGRVERSVLGPGVVVEKGATVLDSVLFYDVRVETGAEVRHALVDERACLGAGSQVGEPPRVTVIAKGEWVAPGTQRRD